MLPSPARIAVSVSTPSDSVHPKRPMISTFCAKAGVADQRTPTSNRPVACFHIVKPPTSEAPHALSRAVREVSLHENAAAPLSSKSGRPHYTNRANVFSRTGATSPRVVSSAIAIDFLKEKSVRRCGRDEAWARDSGISEMAPLRRSPVRPDVNRLRSNTALARRVLDRRSRHERRDPGTQEARHARDDRYSSNADRGACSRSGLELVVHAAAGQRRGDWIGARRTTCGHGAAGSDRRSHAHGTRSAR